MVVYHYRWNNDFERDLYIVPRRNIDASYANYLAFNNKKRKKDKLFYSISEVASMFGVNASLIRFWEKEFDIINPRKNKKGNRFFTQQDIDNVGLVYHYVKERGMTLKGARQKIRENREDAENTLRIVQSLRKVRSILIDIKNNLDD